MLRYLRITVSVVSLAVCALLIVLWVRSYSKFDHVWVSVSSTRTFCVITCKGYASFGMPPVKYFRDKGHLGSWEHSSGKVGKETLIWKTQSCLWVHWTSLQPQGRGLQVIVPFWMLVVLVGMTGTVPVWCGKVRFSLRTLLIATTLIAVLLGAIVLRTR